MLFDSFLLEEKVRHYGDRVAAVAAESPEIAEEALEMIEVEYEPLPAVFYPLKAIQEDAPAIHSTARRGEKPIEIKNNIVGHAISRSGTWRKDLRKPISSLKTHSERPAPIMPR
jgi:CO/xanthine dehydrogenase Mo-binding subunit